MKIRYIRDYLQGSTANAGNHWVQIAAWDVARANMTLTDASSNRAYNKTATSTDSSGSGTRTVNQLGDGDITTTRYFGGAGTGRTYVLMDLGAVYDIDMIQVWHYYGDPRTYFQHEIDVSTDGTNFKVIQQPECNVKETNAGTYYLTMDNFVNGEEIYRWKHQSIEDSLSRAAAKRSVANPTFTTIPSIGNTIPAFVFNEIRAAITAVFAPGYSTVAAGDAITASGWNSQLSGTYKYQSGQGTCGSGCTFTCSVSCNVYCGSACTIGCGAACNANCAGGCYASCGGACSIGGACSSNCTVSCSATCQSNCSCIFSGSCGSGCNYRCNGSCTATCGGACNGLCSSACAGGTCGGACSTACGTQCGALCGSTCAKGCENTCSGFANYT